MRLQRSPVTLSAVDDRRGTRISDLGGVELGGSNKISLISSEA